MRKGCVVTVHVYGAPNKEMLRAGDATCEMQIAPESDVVFHLAARSDSTGRWFCPSCGLVTWFADADRKVAS